MARVRLYLSQTDPTLVFRYFRPGGGLDTIPGLRLGAFVRFLGKVDISTKAGRKAAFPDCIVDTGSHLTLIPEYIWRHFLPGVVTPLRFHPSMPAHHRRVVIAGGTFPYELGELVVPLRDQYGGGLDVAVVAKLTQDGGSLNIPLSLGLRGGFLDGRRLYADPDSAIPHGQRWTLEDP